MVVVVVVAVRQLLALYLQVVKKIAGFIFKLHHGLFNRDSNQETFVHKPEEAISTLPKILQRNNNPTIPK